MTQPSYTTREAVKAALDVQQTAYNDAQVDSAVASSTNAVEGLLHRILYPRYATKDFEWPSSQPTQPFVLWLDDNELISATMISSGGVDITTDCFLEPQEYGPPYDRVEVDQSSSAEFTFLDTPQRAISIVGLWGYDDNQDAAGTLTANVANTTVTTISMSNSATAGVGSLLTVDTERMIVVGKAMATTALTLQANLLALDSDQIVQTTSGAAFTVGETILLDAERMYVRDIAGNNLIVKRAYDGSTLATHSGSTIYALRSYQVIRGAVGSTAATHTSTTAVTVWHVPGQVKSLGTAEAVNTLLSEESGYTRTVGQGEGARNASGAGLADARNSAMKRFGRNMRTRAV